MRKLMAAGALMVGACWAGLAAAEGAVVGEKEYEVLMRSNSTLGGYGGPDMRITSVLAEPAMLVGAQASWLLNHQYFFGVAGYGLATRIDAPEAM